MPSRRQERVSKRIIQELTEAFRNLKNVDLGFITVTRCEVSPDLRHAKVFVSVFGDDERRDKSLATLKNHASKLKGMIGRPLGTKVVPTLHFEFDDTIANADAMSRLIRDARATDADPTPLTEEEIAAMSAAGVKPAAARAGVDVFETVRRDVDAELYGEEDDDEENMGDDDPAWSPINLDELPDDED